MPKPFFKTLVVGLVIGSMLATQVIPWPEVVQGVGVNKVLAETQQDARVKLRTLLNNYAVAKESGDAGRIDSARKEFLGTANKYRDVIFLKDPKFGQEVNGFLKEYQALNQTASATPAVKSPAQSSFSFTQAFDKIIKSALMDYTTFNGRTNVPVFIHKITGRIIVGNEPMANSLWGNPDYLNTGIFVQDEKISLLEIDGLLKKELAAKAYRDFQAAFKDFAKSRGWTAAPSRPATFGNVVNPDGYDYTNRFKQWIDAYKDLNDNAPYAEFDRLRGKVAKYWDAYEQLWASDSSQTEAIDEMLRKASHFLEEKYRNWDVKLDYLLEQYDDLSLSTSERAALLREIENLSRRLESAKPWDVGLTRDFSARVKAVRILENPEAYVAKLRMKAAAQQRASARPGDVHNFGEGVNDKYVGRFKKWVDDFTALNERATPVQVEELQGKVKKYQDYYQSLYQDLEGKGNSAQASAVQTMLQEAEKIIQESGVRERVAGGIPTPTSTSDVLRDLRDKVFAAFDQGEDLNYVSREIISPKMKEPNYQKAEELGGKFLEEWRKAKVEEGAVMLQNGRSADEVDKLMKQRGFRGNSRIELMKEIKKRAAELIQAQGGGLFEAVLKDYFNGKVPLQKVVSALQTERPELTSTQAYDVVEVRVTEFLAEEGFRFAQTQTKGKSPSLGELSDAVYKHIKPIAEKLVGEIDPEALKKFAQDIAAESLSGSLAAGGMTPRAAAERLAQKFKRQRGSLFGETPFEKMLRLSQPRKASFVTRVQESLRKLFSKGGTGIPPVRTSWYEALNTSVQKNIAPKAIGVQAGMAALFIIGTEFSLQLAINYEDYGLMGGAGRALETLTSQEGLSKIAVGTATATPMVIGTEILRGAIVQQWGKSAATALVGVPLMALLPIGFWLQGVEVIAAIDADTKIKEQALAAQNMVSFLGFGNQEPQKEGQKARNANLLYLAEEFAKARGILTIPWWSTSFLQSFGEELVQATQEMEEKRVWVFIYPTTRYFSKLPVDAFVYDSENIPHLPEVLKKKGELAVNLAVRVFNKAKERWRSEKAILREHVEALELQGAEQFTLNYPELASQAGALVQCSLKNSNIDQALQQTIGLQGALSVMGELFTLNEFKNLLEKKGVILSGKYLSSIDCWAKQVENYRAEQTTPTPQEELTKVSSACPEQGQQMVAKLKELLKQDQDGADGYVKNWSPEQIELFISCAADDEELEEIMRSLLLQGQKFPCLDEGC